MSQLANPEDIVFNSFISGLKPDPLNLKVSDWADKYRLLSQKSSAEPGRWRTSRTPYLREILDKLSASDPCDTVVFQKAAQIGATEAGNCWLGYIVDLCPGPTMMVQPTVDMLKRLTKQRLDPMFEETPRLSEKISDKKSRESSNTMFIKEFPGGIMMLAGANSPTGLRSAPIRFLFLDEVDAYPEDCGGEGSPKKLAEARTRTFKRNRKIFIASSPTIKYHSEIESSFEETDQRYYFVPCPHCGHFQILQFDNLRWEEGKYDSVYYSCNKCGEAIEEGAKNQMLAAGEWRATAESKNKKAVGYHLSALYSPLGWFSWSDIAKEWEEAQGDVLALKTFVNTVLGETWQEKGEAPDWERLYRLKEDYQRGTVPKGALMLTAGIDVQRDRYELEITGWGRNLESWSIDYIRIEGDPFSEESIDKLKEIIFGNYESEEGFIFNISKAAIDSGDNTQNVYNLVRSISDPRLIAVKGQASGGLLVAPPRPVDVKSDGRVFRRGLNYYPVAVSMAKDELYSWLRSDPAIEGPNPRGYCHFPDYGVDYFKQLTAEEKKKVIRRGVATYAWEKIRERNEALDCRVYSRAAAYELDIDKFTEDQWKQLENQINEEKILGFQEKKLIKRKKSDFW